MKHLFILWFLCLPLLGYSQSSFPAFLNGTWKVENKAQFEHWDLLNETNLKGISYKIKDNKMILTEYLDLKEQNQEIIYTATVINQNQGKSIHFIMNPKDSDYSFENVSHDFPKKIIYRKISATEIVVEITDGKKKRFSYKMHKQ